jgi:Holliday junction resolvasome RuvABC DNA-binding subunit
MHDKGRIMSQTYYERQSKLIDLYKECIIKKEMKDSEAVMALRLIGFSESMASSRVREWAGQDKKYEVESCKSRKQRLKQRASLEKYMLRMWLGKKYYDEYIKLHEKYKEKQLTKSEINSELLQLGFSRKFAEHTISKWEDKI